MKHLKNKLIFFIAKLFKSNKKNQFDPIHPNILLVSTTAIGDTLWATPFIQQLKNHYPSSNLSILTSKIGKKVLTNNPFIDELYVIKRHFLFNLRLFFTLKKKSLKLF